jgi:hypothetical protein
MSALSMIAANTVSRATDNGAVYSQLVTMLIVLTMLLGAFLLVIALLTVLRRRRIRAMQAKPRTGPLPDPWKQAADRLELDPPRRRR